LAETKLLKTDAVPTKHSSVLCLKADDCTIQLGLLRKREVQNYKV